MRFRWLHEYWLTTFLLTSILVATFWLSFNNKLTLYIHPRYIVFTVLLSAGAAFFAIGEVFIHNKIPACTSDNQPGRVIISIICILICFGIVVVRPSSLTSFTANNRIVNSGALALSTKHSVKELSSGSAESYEQFSIKEWASLLAQMDEITIFQNKTAHITGFVSQTPDNRANIFFLSRFVITCCAIDARPIGVPIYLPDWHSKYKADQWLEIKGTFIHNPENSEIPVVLEPKSITITKEPADPYVY